MLPRQTPVFPQNIFLAAPQTNHPAAPEPGDGEDCISPAALGKPFHLLCGFPQPCALSQGVTNPHPGSFHPRYQSSKKNLSLLKLSRA